jgi:hypothetical protein
VTLVLRDLTERQANRLFAPEMHDAARAFQAAFIVANLDTLRALPILRVPGQRA